MKRKVINITLVFLIVGMASVTLNSHARAATTIFVPDSYPTIQAAINAANPGDTIIVQNGTYVENVVINKNLTLKSLNGANFTTIQGVVVGGWWQAVSIGSSAVTIDGFKVVGPGADQLFWYNSQGVVLNNGISRTLIKNSLINGFFNAIYIWDNANGNVIRNNTIENSAWGIEIHEAYRNEILDNTVSATYWGLALSYLGAENTFRGNKVTAGFGFTINRSTNNTITQNSISNSKYGLFLGVYPEGWGATSYNSIFLNSFVNNVNNVYAAPGSTNTWRSPQEITYTYNNATQKSHLGNYWSNYNGTDNSGDGVGETPYFIDSDNDSFPLMLPHENYVIILVPGDANGDGGIDALDITKVERIIIGLDAPTPGADANQDGNINALDITKVERLIVGLIP